MRRRPAFQWHTEFQPPGSYDGPQCRQSVPSNPRWFTDKSICRLLCQRIDVVTVFWLFQGRDSSFSGLPRCVNCLNSYTILTISNLSTILAIIVLWRKVTKLPPHFVSFNHGSDPKNLNRNMGVFDRSFWLQWLEKKARPGMFSAWTLNGLMSPVSSK